MSEFPLWVACVFVSMLFLFSTIFNSLYKGAVVKNSETSSAQLNSAQSLLIRIWFVSSFLFRVLVWKTVWRKFFFCEFSCWINLYWRFLLNKCGNFATLKFWKRKYVKKHEFAIKFVFDFCGTFDFWIKSTLKTRRTPTSHLLLARNLHHA